MEHNCNTCENGIFCPTWGDVKCMAFLRRNVYESGKPNDCEKYKKRKSTDEEPKCHCDDCESQLPEDIE